MIESYLAVNDVTVAFGGVKALDSVSFEFTSSKIAAVIGPNGAGKSTLFNCITGLQQPTSGTVTRAGQHLTGRSVKALCEDGIARTFQNLALLPEASVEDNILLGRYRHARSGLLRGALRDPWVRREERRHRDAIQPLIDELGLRSFVHHQVHSLSYGVRKKVEIARALAQEPTLLLLDEPMAGVDSAEKPELSELILRTVRSRDLRIIMVEHDMSVIMGLADEIVVLDFGKKIAHGTPAEIRRNPAVIEAYLGADFDDSPAESNLAR